MDRRLDGSKRSKHFEGERAHNSQKSDQITRKIHDGVKQKKIDDKTILVSMR